MAPSLGEEAISNGSRCANALAGSNSSRAANRYWGNVGLVIMAAAYTPKEQRRNGYSASVRIVMANRRDRDRGWGRHTTQRGIHIALEISSAIWIPRRRCSSG